MGLFVCAPDGSNSVYCYPGDPPTTDPFGTGPIDQPPIDPSSPVDPPLPVDPPPDTWFTPPDYSPTNPVAPLDVSGDGSVSPLDALLIINFINAFGSGPDPLRRRSRPAISTSTGTAGRRTTR